MKVAEHGSLSVGRNYARPQGLRWSNPAKQQTLQLKLSDTLILTRSLDPGRPPQRDSEENLITSAQIGVSLPEFFDGVKAGKPSGSTTAGLVA